MDGRVDRRELLELAGLGTGALILGGVPVDPALARRARRRRVPIARGGSFPQGVCSGAPSSRGITLWTRLEGYRRDRRLYLEVARDPDFRRVVHRRVVRAGAKRDHTVEKRVKGRFLKPGREYWYRFETRSGSSPVGRFRTLVPRDSREPVRVAFFSCQDWQAGYYGAHQAIAREDVDLVVCLGDYIYERNFYEGPRRDTLGANRDGEVQTLAEYRSKYRLYRTDRDLQAMHAAHPFAAIWDDHEVEDNWTGDEPGEETQQVRVPFPRRRRNGFRAFYEYMPFSPVVRRPSVGHDLYRRLRLGRNVELFLLDERRYRDDQPCGDELFVPCPEAESEPRSFLGARQREWLKQGLERSGATWKLVGNQLMVMALDSAQGQPINKDSWDGYGVDRRDVLGHVRSRGIRNVAFLTGDIHTFFAGDVGVDGRGPESVATEFVGGSITSLGIPETVRDISGVPLTKEQYALVTQNIRVVNPHLRYDEQRSRGYGVAEARPNELRVEFKGVEALTRSTSPRTIGRFRVVNGTPRVQVL
jgi:alkaline phosphatase D